MLIKKSGRTIERLAPNSEVVNLKCFSIHVAFNYPSTCLKNKTKKKRSGQQARPRHPENSKRVAIFFQVPRDPLPAVSLGALKRSDQEGNSGEVRRSTEEKKRRVLLQ